MAERNSRVFFDSNGAFCPRSWRSLQPCPDSPVANEHGHMLQWMNFSRNKPRHVCSKLGFLALFQGLWHEMIGSNHFLFALVLFFRNGVWKYINLPTVEQIPVISDGQTIGLPFFWIHYYNTTMWFPFCDPSILCILSQGALRLDLGAQEYESKGPSPVPLHVYLAMQSPGVPTSQMLTLEYCMPSGEYVWLKIQEYIKYLASIFLLGAAHQMWQEPTRQQHINTKMSNNLITQAHLNSTPETPNDEAINKITTQ